MNKLHIAFGMMTALVLTAIACGGPAASPNATTQPLPTPTATSPPPATATATPAEAPAQQLTGAELGKSLSARNGCAACHSIDGSASIGPTWQGLFGKEEALADGSTVTVDEAFLRESIVDPDATIVKGFVAGIMPSTFGENLSEEQIDSIIEYIKTIQ